MSGASDPADRLAAERTELVGRIAALRHDVEGVVAAAAGANLDDEHDPEGATVAWEREQLSALLAAAAARLDEVDAALARVAAGTYGTCVRCGGPIGAERLAARPAAARCVRCA